MRGLLALALIGASASVSPAIASPIFLSCSYWAQGAVRNYELTIDPDANHGLVDVGYTGEQHIAKQLIGPENYLLKYEVTDEKYTREFSFKVNRLTGDFTRMIWTAHGVLIILSRRPLI